MRNAVLGMLMLFALGDACSPPSGIVGVQDYGQITGRVLDAMTNLPIPGALVSVGSLYTAQADSKGAFTLKLVPNTCTVVLLVCTKKGCFVFFAISKYTSPITSTSLLSPINFDGKRIDDAAFNNTLLPSGNTACY